MTEGRVWGLLKVLLAGETDRRSGREATQSLDCPHLSDILCTEQKKGSGIPSHSGSEAIGSVCVCVFALIRKSS